MIPAGRELDAEIARKVFGCKVWSRHEALGKSRTQAEYESIRRNPEYLCDCENGAHSDYDEAWVGRELKYYSTDIAAAWEVVEHMDPTHEFRLSQHKWFDIVKMKWICKYESVFQALNYGDPKSMSGYGKADTPAKSICLAALAVYDQLAVNKDHAIHEDPPPP